MTGALKLVLTVLFLALGSIASAQGQLPPALGTPPLEEEDPPAMLVADRVFVTADRKLIAEGNVEAFQGDIRLRAQRIDRKSVV